MIIQHGDVLLRSIEKMNSLKPVTCTRIVLAEGEVTGHAHVITDVKNVNFYENDGKKYIDVLAPANLTHEEHNTLVIPVGYYEIDQVKEYDPFEEEIRKVRD